MRVWGYISRFAQTGWVVALAALGTMASAQEPDQLSGIVAQWLSAPHGDRSSLSFTYWNEGGEVPLACAACHSEPGFIDFLGADGSMAGVVDHPAAINSPIGCASCHTAAAHALDAVTFPSGITVSGLGSSAVCTVCHAGRQSGAAVTAATADMDLDTVSPDLGFINIHYSVAAAVMHGSNVQGGFQYPGKSYAGRFAHVPGADTCVACHEPHTTEVATDGCLSCHREGSDLRAIRMRHSDFDGDGNTAGGIHSEIVGLHAQLYDAIRLYAAEVTDRPIAYAPSRFPYFFVDTDADGEIGPDEADRYDSWTPRLLQAAYNYQVVKKDPGGFVHNPAYLMQLLHDSLESLSERIAIDTSGLHRP
jgi:hypothetical protein